MPTKAAHTQTKESSSAAGATTTAEGTAAGTSPLNWLMAWLGQAEVPVDGTEAVPETTETPAVVQSKVQWLTLLPSVPAYESLMATNVTAQPLPEEGQTAAPVAEEEKQVDPTTVGNTEEKKPEGKEEAPVLASDVAVVPVVVIAVPAPVVTEVPKVVTEQPAPAPAVTASAPAAAPVEAPVLALPGEAPIRPLPPQEDKGEIIWSAELKVKQAVPAPAPAPVVVTATPEVMTPVPEMASAGPVARTAAVEGQSEPALKPLVTAVKDQPRDERPQQEAGQQGAGSNANADEPPPRKETAESSPERSAATVKTPVPGRKEQAPANERVEAKATETAQRTTFPVEFATRTVSASETASPAAVEGVVLEPAAPLRPAQIATVQVDVPGLAGGDDAAPMRLVVTQRGDQVNVRLRSFDGGTAPIENSQMQPLLNSLAEKGFTSELKPIGRLDEGVPAAAEGGREKHMAMAESAGSNNDQQAFQNANERQQQNQERQQQQQAFFLRKQMKTVQSEEFNLQTMLENSGSTYQQGASR